MNVCKQCEYYDNGIGFNDIGIHCIFHYAYYLGRKDVMLRCPYYTELVVSGFFDDRDEGEDDEDLQGFDR